MKLCTSIVDIREELNTLTLKNIFYYYYYLLVKMKDTLNLPNAEFFSYVDLLHSIYE